MARFVVLTHDHPFLHWDLMLEQGDRLRTWRLHNEPSPEEAIAAESLTDHRVEYLDYEGPVSGGRGEVRQWDAGEYEVRREGSDALEVWLHGGRLRGCASLQRNESGTGWTFYFRAG